MSVADTSFTLGVSPSGRGAGEGEPGRGGAGAGSGWVRCESTNSPIGPPPDRAGTGIPALFEDDLKSLGFACLLIDLLGNRAVRAVDAPVGGLPGALCRHEENRDVGLDLVVRPDEGERVG